MPLPKPVHQPQFTQEQLAEARRLAGKHTAPRRTVRRARLTLARAAHPDPSHAASAAQCDLDRDTVYQWRRRWAEAGWSLEDAPRSGRPRTFPPEAAITVKALACDRPVDDRRRPLCRFF
jgi:transposase-like protein